MNRYLVDTSIWIDFFRQRNTPGVDEFYRALDQTQHYGITELIFQEVIQGALNEKDFTSLADYLVAQTFFYPKHHPETYRQAAQIYFACRRKGITIRSTIDCLIAQTAIEHDLILLHSDKDFEHIAGVFPALKLYNV
jgi:predicted nucleic acid-binding protein